MGTYLRGLVKALVTERGDEELLLFHNAPGREGGDPVRELGGVAGGEPGVRAVPLSRPRRAVTVWDQLAWPRTLSRCGVDVFHSPFWTLPVMAGSRHALVQTIHDLTPIKIPGAVSFRNRMIFRANFACARRARLIIVPSRATAEDVRALAGIPAEKIREIPEAVDAVPELLEGAPGRLPGLRERFGIPGRYLLHTGGHDPVKDLGTAVEAAAILSAKGQDLRLVITGETGSLNEILSSRATRTGLGDRLVLTGFIQRADLVALYHGAAAVLYPSLNEGFGLPVLEAMTCGSPVVASRAGALPQVGGEACLYAAPARPGEFAAAAERILNDDALARGLRDAGRARAAEFTWGEAARRTLDVYREAAA